MFFYFPHFIDDTTGYREVISTSNYRTEINDGSGTEARMSSGILSPELKFSSVQLLSHVWLCNPMDCSMLGFLVHHQLQSILKLMSIDMSDGHSWVMDIGDAIQSFHPLSCPSPPDFNLSQHKGLFKWVSSLHHVAKLLKFQLQRQSFQWISRTDFL